MDLVECFKVLMLKGSSGKKRRARSYQVFSLVEVCDSQKHFIFGAGNIHFFCSNETYDSLQVLKSCSEVLDDGAKLKRFELIKQTLAFLCVSRKFFVQLEFELQIFMFVADTFIGEV